MPKKYIVFILIGQGLKLNPNASRKVLDLSFKLTDLTSTVDGIAVFAAKTIATSEFVQGLGDTLGKPDLSPTDIAFYLDGNPCKYPWLKRDALKALETNDMVIHVVESKSGPIKDWFTVEYVEVPPGVLVSGGRMDFAQLEFEQ